MPLSFITTYQNVRNRTVNVFGVLLMMPSVVAAAAMKSAPPIAIAGAVDERAMGIATTNATTAADVMNFQSTNIGCNRGDEYTSAVVPERQSRVAISAAAIAAAANARGSERASATTIAAMRIAGDPLIDTTASANVERANDG